MLARGRGLVRGFHADLAGLVLGLALDVGSSGLGRLYNLSHLFAGRGGEGFAAPTGGALELVYLLGQRVQMGINRVRVVAPPPDGEVLFLDALSVQRHGTTSVSRGASDRRVSDAEAGDASTVYVTASGSG